MKTINYMGMDIPLDDEKTWQFLSRAKNLKGLFQLETSSASHVLGQIKPRNIEDLSICNALNRPGAMKFTQEVAEIRDGKNIATYLHPSLEPFLKNTYGKLIYQESVLQIAQKLANFQAKESNALLKALGKKKKDVMKAQKEAFVNGMKKNGFEPAIAEELFQYFEDFADYSFNKSHSISYSIMGFVSAYIKLHYPLQFYTALMNYAQYEQKPIDEISESASELAFFGISVLPPSVDKTDNKFMIEGGNIRYPIGLIKGLGESFYDKLKSIPKTQTTSVDGFLEAAMNSGLNSRSIESIIISGGLDKFNVPREDLLFYYWVLSELQEDILERFWVFKNGSPLSKKLIFNFVNFREALGPKTKTKQLDLFGEAKINTQIKYKSYFKTETTRLKTLKKAQEYIKTTQKYKKDTVTAKFFWETYVLGYAYNYKLVPNAMSYKELNLLHEKQNGNSFGFVDEIKFKVSHKGNNYAVITLKFDIKQNFMLFSHVCDGARDVVREGDFVSFSATKLENKLKVDSINVINNVRDKYEFYHKEIEKKKKP